MEIQTFFILLPTLFHPFTFSHTQPVKEYNTHVLLILFKHVQLSEFLSLKSICLQHMHGSGVAFFNQCINGEHLQRIKGLLAQSTNRLLHDSLMPVMYTQPIGQLRTAAGLFFTFQKAANTAVQLHRTK